MGKHLIYQLHKQQCINIMTSIIREPYNSSQMLYKKEIPYWSKNRTIKDYLGQEYTINIFQSITRIYGTEIFSDSHTNISSTKYLNYKNNMTNLKLDIKYAKVCLKKTIKYEGVFAINNFKMFKVIDNQLYSTMLSFLIDPLEYITNIELVGHVPHESMIFFNTIRNNIKKQETRDSYVYWLLNYSHIGTLVLDITIGVLKLYIRILLDQLSALVNHTKKKLQI